VLCAGVKRPVLIVLRGVKLSAFIVGGRLCDHQA
jgi:hypothetical protein